jgi:hypothetical protein
MQQCKTKRYSNVASYSRNDRPIWSDVFSAVRSGCKRDCVISQLQEKVFSVGSIQRLYHEDQLEDQSREGMETDQSVVR